jgi:aryl-alcohol dehydrogenase-like predicted oxidoreductase
MPEGARLTDTKRLADRYMTDANWKAVEALDEFATKRGHTLLELAFSWLVARPVVSSVIAGATKPEQVEQNAKAADWALTSDDVAEIDRLTKKT